MKQAVTRWRQQALAVINNPTGYTETQRATAWAFLRQHGVRS